MRRRLRSIAIGALIALSVSASASSVDDVADVIIGIAISKGIEVTLGASAVNPISALLVSLSPSDIGECPAVEDPDSAAYKQVMKLREQHGFTEEEIDEVIAAVPGC